MIESFRVLSGALRDVWRDVWTALVCNLLWLLAVVLVIPAGPATVALFQYTNLLARGEVADVGDFLRAFRRHFRLGLKWGLLNGFLLFILAGDAFLTGRLLGDSPAARYVQGFYLAALLIWMWLQVFALAFLFEQEQPDLRQALRNAASLFGRNILFVSVLGLLTLVTLLAGGVLFMLSGAVGGVLLALIGNHAVRLQLQPFIEQRSTAEE